MSMTTVEQSGLEAIFQTWIQAASDYWGPYANLMFGSAADFQTDSKATAGIVKDCKVAMSAAAKNLQILAKAMTSRESVSSLFKSSGTIPEILLKLAEKWMHALYETQTKSLERFGRLAVSTEGVQLEDADESLFYIWSETYEKEFRQVFRMPQLGMSRQFQEKINQSIDHYNIFQSSFAEFLRLLGLPFIKSLGGMQDKLTEMMENRTLPDDAQVYYQMWIKTLEGHYMMLFQTPEYVETLCKTINAWTDFSSYRDACLEEMLSALPVAKRTEMDDLADEVYQLKKRVQKLESLLVAVQN